MELKRIIARDSRAANEKAIQLYGPDVLVISSQRVDNQTELIVAIDTADNPAPAPARTAPPQPVQGAGVRPAQGFSEVFKASVEQPRAADSEADREAEWEPAAWRLAGASSATAPAAPAAPAAPTRAAAVAAAAMATAAQVRTQAVAAPDAWPEAGEIRPEPRLRQPQAPLQVPLQTPRQMPAAAEAGAELPDESDSLQRSRDTVELLRQEIAALRQEFNLNRQVVMWQSGQGLSPELTRWFAEMQELGVPASLRTLMVDAVGSCETVTEAWPRVHKTLTDAIARRKSRWPQKGVHALVGPSGSGKSLMVARMAMSAARQMPVEQMAIISLADTRPGAWSQLQVLAAQSGVSCYRAADAGTLEVLLQDLSHHALIWIDTPGTDFLGHARTLQTASSGVSLHAVLPLDATVTNVRKIFETTDIDWSSLMLTKLDEAAHPWPVIKSLCDRPLPVSAMGSAPQAAAEPLPFDGKALVDLAMQGLVGAGVTEAPPVAPARPRRRAAPSKAKAAHA